VKVHRRRLQEPSPFGRRMFISVCGLLVAYEGERLEEFVTRDPKKVTCRLCKKTRGPLVLR